MAPAPCGIRASTVPACFQAFSLPVADDLRGLRREM
jgi:hypothetical protein